MTIASKTERGNADRRRFAVQTSDWLSSVVGAITVIALSLWLGGLVAIGAVVAPAAFSVVRTIPQIAGESALQSAIAGGIVGASLHAYNNLSLVCAAIMVGAAIRARGPAGAGARAVLLCATVVAAAMTAFEQFALFPAMNTARAAGNPVFSSLHHEYEALAQIQLVVLLVVAASYARLIQRGANS